MMARLGYSMRKATQAARSVPEDWEQQGELFVLRLANLVFGHGLHKEDVVNLDETGLEVVGTASGGKTRAFKGSKDVAVQGLGDKRQLTATAIVDAAGNCYPWQIIYKGKDGSERALPKNMSELPGFGFYQTSTHWATKESFMDVVEKIIIPQQTARKQNRREAGEEVSQKTVVILDVYKVHVAQDVTRELKIRFPNIIFLFVPPGCTSKFQPLDLSVNSVFKSSYKRSYYI